MTIEDINEAIQECGDTNSVSDGFHTFGELYQHRIALFIALCHILTKENYQPANKRLPWKSLFHHDGTHMVGWFIAGIGVFEGEQVSYHLPESMWSTLHVREFDRAPVWDGHTPEDVVKRLLEFA